MYMAKLPNKISISKYGRFFLALTFPQMSEISALQNGGFGNGKYLGLSFMVGINKKVVFNFIKDRLWKRIKHLSKVSKEVPIKFCAQDIPTYCMSVFLLPTSLEDELQIMMKFF